MIYVKKIVVPLLCLLILLPIGAKIEPEMHSRGGGSYVDY